MIKPALLLGTILLSYNAFAASVSDLNSALNKANQKTAQSPTKIIYGGRDILHPQVANANQAVWEGAQTQVG